MKKTTAYARKRARMTLAPQDLAMIKNPVFCAVSTVSIFERLKRLQADIAISGYIGNNPTVLCDKLGAMAYIVMHGAAANGLADTPDARILLSTANALLDLRHHPDQLERHRPSIIAGTQALDRLARLIHPLDLGVAEMEMDKHIQRTGGLSVADIAALRAANDADPIPTTGALHALIKSAVTGAKASQAPTPARMRHQSASA